MDSQKMEDLNQQDEATAKELNRIGAEVMLDLLLGGVFMAIFEAILVYFKIVSPDFALSFLFGWWLCATVGLVPSYKKVIVKFRVSYLRDLRDKMKAAQDEILKAKMESIAKAISEKIDVTLVSTSTPMSIDMLHNKVVIKTDLPEKPAVVLIPEAEEPKVKLRDKPKPLAKKPVRKKK